MATSAAHMRATTKYKKEKIKRVAFEVQNKYWNETLSPMIERSGMSINGFIKMCIEEYIRLHPDS